MTTKYGPIVGFYLGGQPQVLITDLELIKLVMIRDFDIFSKSINVMDVTSSFGFLSNFIPVDHIYIKRHKVEHFSNHTHLRL